MKDVAGPLVADGDDPARRPDAARFGLTYMGADNHEHTPVVIHRALLGSLERFIGILIEHYGGAFPFWLAPVQVRVLPVGEEHREAARRCRRSSSRGLPRRRRRALGDRRQADPRRELEKVPYVVVWGDRESDEALAVRKRGAGQSTIRSSARRVPSSSHRPGSRRACYARACKAGADPPLTSGAELRGVQPS